MLNTQDIMIQIETVKELLVDAVNNNDYKRQYELQVALLILKDTLIDLLVSETKEGKVA